MDYTEHNDRIEVPKSAGVEGFLHALKSILTLPNVQRVEISAKGEVSYKYFLPKDEKAVSIKIEFDSLAPYAVVRNSSSVTELALPHNNAAVAIAQLFNLVAQDHLHPLAWVGSPHSQVWAWYQMTTAITPPNQESLFGLPFWSDRMVEDGTLILCAGFAKDGGLIDTHKSYKLCIPTLQKEVNVL